MTLETALENNLEPLVVSNVLRDFAEEAISSLNNLKTSIVANKVILYKKIFCDFQIFTFRVQRPASRTQFAQKVALPNLVMILNQLLIKMGKIRKQLEHMEFVDSLYLLTKMDSISDCCEHVLNNLPKPNSQDILADVENLLHELKSIRVPVLSTLPPLIVSFGCKATDGATFAYLTIPTQNLMFNSFCSGSLYNKVTTSTMTFVAKSGHKTVRGTVAAQITYRAWVHNMNDSCPANNEATIGHSLKCYAAQHEYEEKTLLAWTQGQHFCLLKFPSSERTAPL